MPGKRNTREQREKRRIKRQQVEQSYKDHVPPQVRHLRQGRWFARVNPDPQDVPFSGDVVACPMCPKNFINVEFLRAHMNKRHSHRVPRE